MGDLLGFQGFLNKTTPFNPKEYDLLYKSDRKYLDFEINNARDPNCKYPQFWLETGEKVGPEVTSLFDGCTRSDFDAYGSTEAFGLYPDWVSRVALPVRRPELTCANA